MMSKSKIEWTDVVWNPIAGCSKVSAGCKHCYAERLAARCVAMGVEKYVGTVDGAGRWTGKVNFDEKALLAPLGWRKPRMVFVNSMSDLFHPEVPDEWVDRVFAVMALCPQHVFQVLTKRPERMAEYFEFIKRRFMSPRSFWSHIPQEHHDRLDENPVAWPLPNVWLGVSVENQATADERVLKLAKCPAAVRFLSCEPLLEGISLAFAFVNIREQTHEETGEKRRVDLDGNVLPISGAEAYSMNYCDPFRRKNIDWVICGGESGVGYGIRPMHPDWARGLRDQCVGAGVPFFFKQWGNFAAVYDRDQDASGSQVNNVKANFPRGRWVNLEGGHGFHGDRVHWMVPVGKVKAGRLLDGREWNEMPDQLTVDS